MSVRPAEEEEDEAAPPAWVGRVLRPTVRRAASSVRRSDAVETDSGGVLAAAFQHMFESSEDGMAASENEDEDDDDEEEEATMSPPPAKRKRGKKNDDEEEPFVVSDEPSARTRRRTYNMVDAGAESSVRGPDPLSQVIADSVHGNDLPPQDGLVEVPAEGFVDVDLHMEEDDDEAAVPGVPTAVSVPEQSMSIDDLCRTYTETLRTHRMTTTAREEFSPWTCWYCNHREDMRQIPADMRTTVMQSFGLAMDTYETAPSEVQARVLYKLWASIYMCASIRGERPSLDPEDVMTEERFLICLRDHISPTERPVTAINDVSRQILSLLSLLQDHWEREQWVQNPNGTTTPRKYIDYKAVNLYYTGVRTFASLLGMPQAKLRRVTSSSAPPTTEETVAINHGLRLRAVRRQPSRARE